MNIPKPNVNRHLLPASHSIGDTISKEDWDGDYYNTLRRVLNPGGALARSLGFVESDRDRAIRETNDAARELARRADATRS